MHFYSAHKQTNLFNKPGINSSIAPASLYPASTQLIDGVPVQHSIGFNPLSKKRSELSYHHHPAMRLLFPTA